MYKAGTAQILRERQRSSGAGTCLPLCRAVASYRYPKGQILVCRAAFTDPFPLCPRFGRNGDHREPETALIFNIVSHGRTLFRLADAPAEGDPSQIAFRVSHAD